jgi:hypothetical protein
MELTEELKTLFIETAKSLKGSDRRVFMARVVKLLGSGGQRRAAAELGWDRDTIRKGRHELDSGFRCYDHFSGRGRHRNKDDTLNLPVGKICPGATYLVTFIE